MTTITPLSRLQELLPQLFTSTQLPGDRYLRFQLSTEISALLSMEYVQESMLVSSEQITPIPNMSGSVIGLMSSRDRVFCAIDLAQLVGFSSLSVYLREYQMVVIRLSQLVTQPSTPERELFLGLVVNHIQGIMRVMSDEMRSPQGEFPPNLTPYIQGSVIDKEKPLPILNLATIVKQAQKP